MRFTRFVFVVCFHEAMVLSVLFIPSAERDAWHTGAQWDKRRRCFVSADFVPTLREAP